VTIAEIVYELDQECRRQERSRPQERGRHWLRHRRKRTMPDSRIKKIPGAGNGEWAANTQPAEFPTGGGVLAARAATQVPARQLPPVQGVPSGRGAVCVQLCGLLASAHKPVPAQRIAVRSV
jgi:hypothetical protein